MVTKVKTTSKAIIKVTKSEKSVTFDYTWLHNADKSVERNQ